MTSHTVESTLLLHLSETHSGDDAAHHQRFIEREGPCIASFGTLAGTVVERHRVWHAIDRLGTRRRGWIELGRVDDGPRLEEIEKTLRRWVAEERVDDWLVAQWTDGARQLLEGTAEQNLPGDWKCKVSTHDSNDHDTMLAALRVACGERRSPSAEPLQITDRRPRASVVQRRIALELAPELGIDSQEDIVRTWCESNLAEVSWHACIHRDRDERDAWRDRAYVVYPQFRLEPELDDHGWATGWWTFERAGRLPPPAGMVNVLWGKGEQGRTGTQALIESWRNSLVELQNARLEAEGAGRRFRSSAHRHGRPETVAPVRSMGAHGRSGVESSSGQAGLSSIEELGAKGVVETWLERWRVALTDEPEGQHVGGIAASIVEPWSAEEKRHRVRDPRPVVRALCAHARRWNRDTEKWRSDVARICDLLRNDGEGMADVESLFEDLDVHGIRLQSVATTDQQSSLGEAQWCVQAVKEIDETRVTNRGALDVENINKRVIKWLVGSLGHQVRACSAGRMAVKELVGEAEQRKTELSQPGDVFGLDVGAFETMLKRRVRLRGLAERVLTRKANRDSDIDLHWLFSEFSSRKLYSQGDDPVLDGLKLSLEKRIDERRKAIWEAGRTIGVTATVSQERWRQIAQLAPTDAARWVGRDLRFVKFLESELWDAVEVPLRRFVPVAKRRRRKVIARAAPREEDWAVTAAFSAEELAALDSIASEVAKTIAGAKSRAEAQDVQVAEVLTGTVWRVCGARDPRERSMLKTGLVDELAKERARTALSRVAWMRLVRESGLGPMEVADALRIKAAETRTVSGNARLNSHDCQIGPPTDVRG